MNSADPMLPTPYEVLRFVKETSDVFTLSLRPKSKTALPRFEPGQFNMLYVFGVGESAISISGNPEDGTSLIHTIRAVGVVTEHLEKVREGTSIGIRGPFGSAWPIKAAEGSARPKDVVLVAGGIGLAPLRPVLYHIASHRSRFGRVTLLYGARSPKDLLFTGELERWKTQHDIQVEITVDHAEMRPNSRATPRASTVWKGDIGVVPTLISRAQFDPNNAVAMLCGPEIMMRFTVAELSRIGMPENSIYLSMERNMKCAVGFCGHCQYMGHFLCKDGPVYTYETLKRFFVIKEL